MTTSTTAVRAYFGAFGRGHSRKSAARIAGISERTAGNLERRYRRGGEPLPVEVIVGESEPQRATASLTVIGERLKAARKDARLTQVELSEAVGVKQPTLSRWESGKELPLSENQEALCRALGVGWADLFALAPPSTADGWWLA